LLRRIKGATSRLTPAARRTLQGYRYPGNVRELRNIVERAALLADGGAIDVRHLPEFFETDDAAITADVDLEERKGSPLATAEREALRSAVRQHMGSRRELAKALGLSERTLYRKLRDLELSGRAARRLARR
jgi:DNA-binding NtrC family response regulator